MDFPQSYMEPILIKYASQHGFQVRFHTELKNSVSQPGGGHLVTLFDMALKHTYQIHTQFLLGADGGRSTVARLYPFEFDAKPSKGVACNILFNADLNHMMDSREAQLHWIMNPLSERRFGVGPALRMVRPWTQWMAMTFAPLTAVENPFKDLTPDDIEIKRFIQGMIGDKSVAVEILRVDPWAVRETVATRFSINNDVFLLGDSAHRHPPAYGLGSNTCIQDAYNLAWKLSYVSKGWAGSRLLDSYNAERQPVGAKVVRESNTCMNTHARVWKALGMFAPDGDTGREMIEELKSDTAGGAARREELHQALQAKRREGESIGFTMNQWYTSSAVYLEDEISPRPKIEGDDIVETLISTYPGNRLPHAWLDIPARRKEISTHDLAGGGAFCLLTGHGGDLWRTAAHAYSTRTDIPIKVFAIGIGLDYYDVYREWHERREVAEGGCVLVRPDRFVAWRSREMTPNPSTKLARVMDKILSRSV